jgi:hypothetical protein
MMPPRAKVTENWQKKTELLLKQRLMKCKPNSMKMFNLMNKSEPNLTLKKQD